MHVDAFGPAWEAGVYHDGRGLQHRPLLPSSTPRYTPAGRDRLLLLTREADALTGRLRLRYLRADRHDRRLLRVCASAERRFLRREWLRRRSYLLATA